ncbi:MAG: oligosaccharide flippase family protein [Candidatus Cloacimonadaceae bacterium]
MSNLVKQAGIISAADFLRLFVKTIIGIVLARILTQAEYGTYRQLFMIYTLMAAIFMVGLPQSVYYFLPKSDAETRQKFIRQTVDLFSVLGLVSACLLLIFRDSIALAFNNPELSKILVIYAVYPFFMFLSQLYYSIMIGLQQPKRAAGFIIFSLCFDFVLILGTALLTKDLFYITGSIVLSVLIQWIYARFNLRKYTRGSWFDYDKELLRSQFRFALPIGVAAIIGVISAQVDKIIISSHFSPELFAVFAVGATELPFIGIITNSVNAVILPEMSRKDNVKAISDLYKGAVRKNALILFPLFVFCFVFATQIIELLYSAKYLDSVLYFRIYLFTIPLRIATYGLLFQVFNRTKFIFIISTFTLMLNTALSLILISLYGLKGPAISTVIVTYLTVTAYLILIKTKLRINLTDLFRLNSLFRILSAAALSGFVCYPLQLLRINSLWQFVAGFMLFGAAYYLFGRLFKAILPYDREVVNSMVSDIISKLKRVSHV